MIKLFRNIRKRLITDGKTATYFTYAIGEIILVVFGILIALYLNNEQQDYTIHKQQENYLRQIRGEMVNNLKSLKVEKEELTIQMGNAHKLLNIMNNDSLTNTLSEFDISQMVNEFLISRIVVFNENGALNQVIYAGGLKDIRNDSIKSSLAAWEGKVNRIRIQENQVAEATGKIKQYLAEYGDYRSLADDLGYAKLVGLDSSNNTKGNRYLLKSKEFENYVFEYFSSGFNLKEVVYADFEKEMQSLIDLIDQEISN